MASGVINIDPAALDQTATKVRTINDDLYNYLKNFQTKIDMLDDSSWQSEGSQKIIAAINELAPNFDKYKQVIESYADFLIKTKDAYIANEETIKTNADNIAATQFK